MSSRVDLPESILAERAREQERERQWEALTAFKREQPKTPAELLVYVRRWRELLNNLLWNDSVLENGRDIVRRTWEAMRRIGGPPVPELPILREVDTTKIFVGKLNGEYTGEADEALHHALDTATAWCGVTTDEHTEPEEDSIDPPDGIDHNPKATDVLLTMLELGAVGSSKKTTKVKIVAKINRKHTPDQYRGTLTLLRISGCTESSSGPPPTGGIWLTGKGKTKAEQLKAERSAV